MSAEIEYPKVELHFRGMFIRNPIRYDDGVSHMFTDHDFAGMSFSQCIAFIERFTQEKCIKLYYCPPNKPLHDGIRQLSDDIDYTNCMLDAYDTHEVITLYVDHFDDTLEGFFEERKKEREMNEKADEGVVKQNIPNISQCERSKEPVVNVVDVDIEVELEDSRNGQNKEEHVDVDGNGDGDNARNGQNKEEHVDGVVNGDGVNVTDVNIDFEDVKPDIKDLFTPIMKRRTADDAFLNKLCPDNIEDGNDMDEEEDYDSMHVHPIFNEAIPWKKQLPVLGMRFKNAEQLKIMLCNYAVSNGYQLYYEKNTTKKVLAKCSKGQCSFRLWATWMSEEISFQIKSLKEEHNCARNYKLGSLVTYKWIGGHYTKEILHRKKLSARKLRAEVIKKFGVQVSIGQCRRARIYALQVIEGTLQEHYARLWSYAEEIRRSNPGSNVRLDVQHMPDGVNYFSKFYVCFEGLKRGWIGGCRRVISLDGSFLKGLCKGEVLSAVGRDANDQMFPIAWAVVNVENKDNWKWFLDNLADDLELHSGGGLTLMSDQHKGLIEAVKEVLPHAEHRQCARHICANLKKKCKGAEYEILFWRAAKATTPQAFKAVMRDVESLNPVVHQYLVDKNPHTWSRAFFTPGRCCDNIENGMSESFNAIISNERKLPIITMLEEIRMYMMEKLYKAKLQGQQWGNHVCPKVRNILNEMKVEQRNWHVIPAGLNHFEVRSRGESFEVNLEEKTCTCRLWQVNGIGCVHSVASISFMNGDVEAYVDKFFSTTFYKKAYMYRIAGLNGVNMWPETSFTPPLPPMNRRMPGRPCVKRKRDATENAGRHTVSKSGKTIKCSICKGSGHNKSSCKKNEENKNQKKMRRETSAV